MLKVCQMCSIFSLAAAKPCCIKSNNVSKFLHPRFIVTRARAQVITAPNKPSGITSTTASPQLLKQGIPHSDLHILEIVERQSQASTCLAHQDTCRKPEFHPSFLEEAYERCRNICAEYAKTFYLGTLLMTEERQKAIWAIYGGKRDLKTSLKDDPMTCLMLLTDTVFKFPLDIKPFRDMIEGMRMDMRKCRYENFQQLYLYCYYVAGTVGLMTVPVMGIAPESCVSAQTIYNGALYLGIGNQLTNILRDVGEEWREFMKEQITRARYYFNLAEEGAYHLDKASRWPVWSCLMLYRKILDAIEDNDYDNLTKRAFVGRTKKLLTLPLAYAKAQTPPSLIHQ
ncbi:hypothetical protein GH714_012602 [Hevea brasiliensis]|uniref:15-cis-phytoene synthase n=1 Tax=Hevea brasiliensis TaxID=3981 RepID=A0A6A6KBG2_HEVBR|nr:hypothetical protein GH714_012602 [Hevea brasiliensis]